MPAIDRIYKAGAVVMRRAEYGEVEFLIVRPVPSLGDNKPIKWVLPRGSRQYWDAKQQSWIDARDAETARAHWRKFEDVSRTIMREMDEEAGIPPTLLRTTKVSAFEMGIRRFESSSKKPYNIYWAILLPDKEAQSKMIPQTQHMLEPTRWVTMEQILELNKRGEFSSGYIPVAEEAAELAKKVAKKETEKVPHLQRIKFSDEPLHAPGNAL